jgi:DNA-directed RNA polymerase subunit alpha
MSIILGRLEMPRKFVKDESVCTDVYAKYIIEPFERGFGHTLGNAMRRTLLSSIEGAALTSIKIEGVQHEISTIPGVVEDIPEIILNLKKLKIKLHTRESRKLTLVVDKKGEVKASDITPDSAVEIMNPDMHIMTLDKKIKIEMEMEIKIGRGYVPSEINKVINQPIGVIPMDSIFSPVIRVNYSVETTRIGQRTDYDKLILEIWTDGRITPDDALTQCAAILREHLNAFVDFEQTMVEFEEKESKSKDEGRLQKLLNTSINEIELSVRSSNCIQRANIKTIGDLVCRGEPEMLKFRNFGKKSLNEIKKVLADLGLSLGMNVEELLKAEQEESGKVGKRVE